MSWRRLQDVLEDEKCYAEDVFNTSWRRLGNQEMFAGQDIHSILSLTNALSTLSVWSIFEIINLNGPHFMLLFRRFLCLKGLREKTRARKTQNQHFKRFDTLNFIKNWYFTPLCVVLHGYEERTRNWGVWLGSGHWDLFVWPK